MSVAEKKSLAVEKLKAFGNETAIDEIFEHSEKITERYNQTLQKLAQ